MDVQVNNDWPGAAIKEEWKPHPRQAEFLKVPFSIFEVLYGGAAGGGKTDAVVLMPLIYGFHNHPNYKGLTLRRTFPDLEQEIILRSHKWYRPSGATYNEKKKRWTWPSGAIEQFGHCEHKNDIRNFDGSEWNKVSYEEATHFEAFQYIYLVATRVRTSDSSLPAIVRSTSNPGNVGHGFFRKRFVEPFPNGGKIILDKRTGLKRLFIRAFLKDNPSLMHGDPDYIRKLEMLPEAEKRAKLYGDWWTYEGQVFDSFRSEHFGDEPAWAIHVIPEFDIPDSWPKIAVLDWGFSAMTWFGVLAIAPNGQVFVYHEETFEKTLISSWATEVGKFLDTQKNVVSRRLDSNAWENRGEEETVADQIQTWSTYSWDKADKGPGSRVSGKLLLQEYLRFTPKPARKVPLANYRPELAEQIIRVHGAAKYEEYLNLFREEKPETNLPKLQIFRTCKKLIECLPLCIYDENNKEDVKEFEGDDPYDGLRYGLRAIDSYVNESKLKFEELQKVAKVVEAYQHNGNVNTYYRQLEYIEKKQKELFGVRRFNSKRVH